MSQPLGKILHLTLDGRPAPDNPWAGKTGDQSVRVSRPPSDTVDAQSEAGKPFAYPGANVTPAEVWSLGHRNPYGLAFAPDGRLWETEMGPQGGDELNLIERGRNYGWPLVSEGENYNGVGIPKPATRPELESAKLFWVPSISPTSLVFYSGKLWPEWKGNAFIGSLSGQALVRATVSGTTAAQADEWNLDMRIRFATEGPDGALYLLEDGSGGRLLKLTPAR
jgi:glucose/arabinose dehydrogenase